MFEKLVELGQRIKSAFSKSTVVKQNHNCVMI